MTYKKNDGPKIPSPREELEKEQQLYVINTSKIGILQYFYFLSVFIQSIFI